MYKTGTNNELTQPLPRVFMPHVYGNITQKLKARKTYIN
jgi:hypothetical protein